MTATAERTSTTVVDNPAYAWRNVAERVKDAFYGQLDADFVHDYRAQLDEATTVLFGPVLITVWSEQGFQVAFGPDGDSMLRRPAGPPWYRVWDEACRRLDPYAVVFEARLDDELVRYAAAHPRIEHLARALDGIRPHHTKLRAELNARLDHHAETATDPRAEAQLDGWRSLLDTAVSRAQLDQLATDIPA